MPVKMPLNNPFCRGADIVLVEKNASIAFQLSAGNVFPPDTLRQWAVMSSFIRARWLVAAGDVGSLLAVLDFRCTVLTPSSFPVE
jgi:hypothetical protein